MEQFNDEDKKATMEFLRLLVNLGATPLDAAKQVNAILEKLGWAFAYFNDIEDFWITSNELK